MFPAPFVALALAAFQGTLVVHETPNLVEGRVVFEEDGVRRPVSKGTFQFWVHGELRDWSAREVEIRDGAFAIAGETSFGWAMPGRMLLDGREAWTDYQLWAEDVRDAKLPLQTTLVARPVKPLTLTVLDGPTGAPLEDIEILRREPFEPKEAPANEPTGSGWPRVGSKWSSPVALPAFETGDDSFNHGYIGICTYWLRAPGHAWNRVRVDPTSGGERRVRLWPAMLFVGTQKVELPSGTAWFAARTDDPARVVELSWTNDGLLTPLAPGAWKLEVRPTGASENATLPAFASVDLELAEGSVTSVSSDWAEAIAKRATEPAAKFRMEKRQRVAGTVRIPAEWKPLVERVRLVSCEPERKLEPIDVGDSRWKQSAADPELYSFEFDAVALGKWCLEIMPLSWRGIVRVEAGSASKWDFSIPAPSSNVRVLVIDALTKTDIGTSLEIWSASEGSFDKAGARREITALEPGVFEFRAPSGPLTLSVFAPEFSDAVRTLMIAPGSSEHTVELHPTEPRPRIDVRVEAYDGHARIPASEIYRCMRVWSLDQNEFIWSGRQSSSRYEEGAWNTIPAPGRYRFSLNAFDEYEAPAPIEIEVSDVPDQRVVFRLQRIAR